MMTSYFLICGLALIAFVHGQDQFHLTPNIAAVEQNIQAGQFLSCLEDLQDAINIPDPFSLEIEESHGASNGHERQKLRILYDGVPIRRARLQASIDSQGFYTGAVSGYYPTNFPVNFDVSPQVTESTLRSTLVDYLNANDYIPPFLVGALSNSMLQDFVYEKQIDIDLNTGVPLLVYFFRCVTDVIDVVGGTYIRFPRGLIRVSDLTVMRAELRVLKDQSKRSCPKVKGGNLAFPGPLYGPGKNRVCLNAKKNGKFCEYSNDHVAVYDVDNNYDRSSAEVVSFKCSKGPKDGINGGFSPSSDAFYHAQVFLSLLKKWTGLERTNNNPLKMFVHFGVEYPNSFFDGRDVTFGDGSNDLFPVTVREVIGHEMGHTITEEFGNLQLSTESLAVSEAFSDICGKAVTIKETGQNDWTIAQAMLKPQSFPANAAIRYFDDPTRDGNAIDNLNDFNPSLDLYSMMGIYLKFMFNVVDQEGIPFRQAFQAMTFANKIYWNEESSLVGAACGVLRAASDLALDSNAFKSAFGNVGIDLNFCDLSGTQDIIIAEYGTTFSRKPTVSKHKTPSFIIRPCAGVSNLFVSVACSGQFSILVEENGNVNEYHDYHISIPLGTNDIVVSLKSDEKKEFEVNVNFAFY